MSTRAQIPMKAAAAPVRRPTPAAGGVLQRKCSCGGSAGSGGDCAECKKKKLQRRAIGGGPEIAPPIVHQVLRSPGQPLEAQTRAFFEPRFGHDFSKVRVHSDAEAAESAHAVNALAYTVGPQIVFGPGQYRPGDSSGRRLLAHELTHVVQQGDEAAVGGPLRVGPSTDSCEEEADRVASAAVDEQAFDAEKPLDAQTRKSIETNPDRPIGGGSGNTGAGKSAKAVSAAAHAAALDIVFRPGQQAPTTKAGASPLAHKVTRVLQQSRGEARLRRKCLADIPAAPADCQLTSAAKPDLLKDKLYQFWVNCDDFYPGEKDRLVRDLKATPAESEITIRGMASADGPLELNKRLSCARATSAVDVVNQEGRARSIKKVGALGAIADTEHDQQFRAVEVVIKGGPPTPETPHTCGPDITDWFVSQVNRAAADKTVLGIKQMLSAADILASLGGSSAAEIAEAGAYTAVEKELLTLGSAAPPMTGVAGSNAATQLAAGNASLMDLLKNKGGDPGVIAATPFVVAAAIKWKGLVETNAPYDFKNNVLNKKNLHTDNCPKDCDEGEVGIVTICPGTRDENCYEADVPGNLFYAAIGRFVGWSEAALQLGSQLAELKDTTFTKYHPKVEWDPPSDTAAIKVGFLALPVPLTRASLCAVVPKVRAALNTRHGCDDCPDAPTLEFK